MKKLTPFKLERYFAKYEFSAEYLLSPSDCEPLTMKEMKELFDEEDLKLWENLWLGYTESQGHPLLKEQIKNLYSDIDVSQIITVVPEEGIYISMNVLLEEGDHVITTFPGYQSLYEVAQAKECEVSKWKPQVNDSNWEFNLDDLKKLIREDTKLLAINFPHNPTGATITNEQLLEIVEICKSNGTYLFSDEMYRFLEYNPETRLPSASDLYENAISLFGVSKSFSLPGLRVGWLTTNNDNVYKQIATYKDYTTICGSAPSEVLAIVALKNRKHILERNLKIINDNLKLVDSFFKKYSSSFRWREPKAGTIGFAELLIDINVEDFSEDIVKKKNLMVLPATVYDYEGNYFRVGFGRRNFREALERLEEYTTENFE